MVILSAFSAVLGLLRDVVIAGVYGSGAALDAYLYAQGLMNLVLALIAGAMAKAVVPPLARAAVSGDSRRADRTLQTVLTLTVLTLTAGSAAVYVFAGQVVTVLAPGFDTGTADLAAHLTRIVVVAAVFVALTDILAGAAQAYGRFFLSGFQGVPFNLVMIATAAWFGPRYGIEALAVGFVVGSSVRLLVQLPAVMAAGLRLRPRWLLRDPDVREVLRMTPPLLLGAAVVNVNTLVDRAVGSTQGEGVISALSFGWRIVTVVDSLLVVTVAAALYPAFSAVGTPERRVELRGLVGRATRLMVVLLAPVVVVLVVDARPIVAVLFGRGEFGSESIRTTAVAVSAYAVSATGLAVRVIAARAFLAVGDSRTPVVVAVVSMAINIVGDLTVGVRYGVAGLAAATSASLIFGAALLLVLLERRHGAAPLHDVAVTTVRVSVAATGAAVVVLVLRPERLAGLGGGSGLALVEIVVSATVILLVYVAILLTLKSRELQDLAELVQTRLLNRQ